jgi:hypothetical protein
MWPQANIKLVSVHTESVSLVTQLDIWVSGAHRICGGNKKAAQKNLPRATQDTGNQPWVWNSVQGRNHLQCEARQRIGKKWFEPELGSEGFVWKGCNSHSAVPKVSCDPTSLPHSRAGFVAWDGIPESEFCPIKRGGIISRSFELILL